MDDTLASTRWVNVFLAGMIAGVILTVGAWSWMVFSKPANVWSLKQAAEFKAANDAVHTARSGGRHGEDLDGNKPDPRYLAAAQARLERIASDLDRARSARDNWGKWGAAAGLALTIACGLGYLATRR